MILRYERIETELSPASDSTRQGPPRCRSSWDAAYVAAASQ